LTNFNFICLDFLWRNDTLRQRFVPYRVVPLFMRITSAQTEGKMVLSQLSRRTTQCYEAEGAILKGTGALQQGKGRENLNHVVITVLC